MSSPAPGTILPNGRILRYTFHERLTHWIASASYLYLLLTGLAFWSPWLAWLAIVCGGGQVSRMLHPWAGLIFVASALYLYVLWAFQMHITEDDKSWWNSLNHYITNHDEEMPPAGRYNAGQKLLFWGFIVCGVILLLTGLILWFPEYIPWNLRTLRYIAVFFHASAALLTMGLFLIHVYMSVFAERGAMDSMVVGDVSQHFAKRYHRRWYDQIIGSRSRPNDPRPDRP